MPGPQDLTENLVPSVEEVQQADEIRVIRSDTGWLLEFDQSSVTVIGGVNYVAKLPMIRCRFDELAGTRLNTGSGDYPIDLAYLILKAAYVDAAAGRIPWADARSTLEIPANPPVTPAVSVEGTPGVPDLVSTVQGGVAVTKQAERIVIRRTNGDWRVFFVQSSAVQVGPRIARRDEPLIELLFSRMTTLRFDIGTGFPVPAGLAYLLLKRAYVELAAGRLPARTTTTETTSTTTTTVAWIPPPAPPSAPPVPASADAAPSSGVPVA
jgi:hypothetical protein